MPTGNIDPIVTQLTQRRRELGIGPHQLSIRCGFSSSHIGMYESGARVPDVTRLCRWAAELGMTIRAQVAFPAEHAEPRTAAGHPAHTPGDSL